MPEKKLFLLDAMALIYRAYYALIRNPRITSTGKNTNAQFGFTTTLVDLINKEKPSHLAVVFDTSAATERHTDFKDYKANRQEAPEDLIAALPDIKRIVRAFRLPCLEKDGYEADDIIGTLALEAAELGYTVYMVTPDKDFGQIVRDNIFIYRPSYQKSGVEIMGPEEVCAKWNIATVDQVIDMLALMGDAVDNIPGIAGIGEKTAARLLYEYGSLERILDQADQIKGAVGKKILAGKEQAILSKKLATIITNAPVPFYEENFRISEWDREKLREIFTELEFRTLGKRILGEDISASVPAGTPLNLFGDSVSERSRPKKNIAMPVLEEVLSMRTIENTPHNYHLVRQEDEIKTLIELLMIESEIAFDTETTHIDPHYAQIIGMSFSKKPGEAFYVSIPLGEEQMILDQFDPLFDRKDVLWIGQNLKYDLTILRHYGKALQGRLWDTMLSHYVIEPEGRRNMDALSEKFLNYTPISIESLIGKGKNQKSMRDVEETTLKEYAAEDADITLQLKYRLEPLLDKYIVRDVAEKIEYPLIPVLQDMEYEGVGIDVDFLNEYSETLEQQIKTSEARVFQHAGVKFNLSSPKQLGDVLFEILKLTGSKKTKTGQYATGEDVLQKLRNQHQIIEDILVYRELTKLKSTYVDTLPALIHPRTGRLHTCFNQAVAVTGRLSSTNPNLQNIPIRTERGREIRKAFISRGQGWKLVSADYSQIELRIMAAMSEDETMIDAFQKQKDIHTATAAGVYGVPETEVTSEMRRSAKAVNFGIIYGQSAWGLAESLGISKGEAKDIIESYFRQYPGIRRFMDQQILDARKEGFVQTLSGRKRTLRDINSSNHTVRGYAERNAINMPIQGTAADMIKLAMIKTHRALNQMHLKTRMLLQVHDELVFDVPQEELETAIPLIRDQMQNALPLPGDVPIVVEAGIGNNWLEAH